MLRTRSRGKRRPFGIGTTIATSSRRRDVARLPGGRPYGELLEFSIPVASEDVGEQLVTQSYIGKRLINSVAMPPSTLDDPEERLVKFNYQVLRDLVGYCHVITLRVGHASTLPDANGPPLDPSDVAVAYWDVIINFPSDGTTTPVCPLEDEATPR
ncbi:MAG: hypothetical protein K0R38_925 [Polyangiaceae bacterium]|nr:hypothetical protein [Polyangiaceae bacterium]